MKGSVEMAASLSPSDRATALQGCLYWKVCRHSPVSTDHIFEELSADAVMRKYESPVQEAQRSMTLITFLALLPASHTGKAGSGRE